MDEKKAREILGDAIQNDGTLGTLAGEYLDWPSARGGKETAVLDGEFTPEQLEAICWWIRNKPKPPKG